MNKFAVQLMIIIGAGLLNAQKTDLSILNRLDQAIGQREKYMQDKYEKIDRLKKNLEKERFSGSAENIYNSYSELYRSYKSFKYDSAYYYLEKGKAIAIINNDSILISASKIDEGFILLSAGLFKEAADTLASVQPELLFIKDRYQYYYTQARLYFDLAEYNDDQRYQIDYIRKGIELLYKSLDYCPPNSSRYWKSYSLIQLKGQKWEPARIAYLTWIKGFDLDPNLYAVATSSLSYIYSQLNNERLAIKYLVLAAVSDIQNATKENTALRNLANTLYQVGELKKANEYVQLALEDATF